MTEDEIWAAMKKFGEIVKVKIPMEELRNGKKRGKGFAFVTFKQADAASHAIDESEIVVDSAILQIERALKAPPRQQESKGFNDQKRDLDFLSALSLLSGRKFIQACEVFRKI